MTSYIQILDIAMNKSFNNHLLIEINDYIENRMQKSVWKLCKAQFERDCELGEEFMA